MLDASLKIWHALRDRDIFEAFQADWLAIFEEKRSKSPMHEFSLNRSKATIARNHHPVAASLF